MQSVSIYIHFPFCLSKCNYCDFISFPVCNDDYNFNNILSVYLKEIEQYKSLLGNRNVKSIYFGGGTPSIAPVYFIEKIILFIYKNFNISDDVEITLEVNPATVNKEKMYGFYCSGVNRISIGIQSLNKENLKFLGRVHSVSDAFYTLELASNYFDNISCDFIYALPGQTLHDWQMELLQISSLPAQHLSLYQLIIEPKTVLYNMMKKSKFFPINEKVAVNMFEYTNKFLKKTFQQYEISNYSKIGFESRHNLNYWNGGDYIGIGVSAAGRIKIDNRFYFTENHKTVSKWSEQILSDGIILKNISKKNRAKELIIMGLRKNKGINFNDFFYNIGFDVWKILNKNLVLRFVNEKLLILTKSYIRASVKGRNILDTIIKEIIL